MASGAIHNALPLAGQVLLRTARWYIMQGNVSRCLSAKVTETAHVIGRAGNHGNLGSCQLPHLSLMSPVAETSEVVKRQAVLGPVSNFDVDFEKAFTRLTVSPLESRLSAALTLPGADRHHTKVIVDPCLLASLLRDCPMQSPRAPLSDPSIPNREIRLPPNGNAAERHASNILHKRRRKMNRHQYLKWKKRNKFKLRIRKQRKEKNRRLKWQQHLGKFRFAGLKPGEGEEFLAKRRAKLAIFLRYLGIETNEEEEKAKKTRTAAPVRRTGRLLPEPLLPKDAKTGANN